MLMLYTLMSTTPRAAAIRQRGQATAEYALVIVGAATLAGLVIAWASSTGRIAKLLNSVLDAVIGKIG